MQDYIVMLISSIQLYITILKCQKYTCIYMCTCVYIIYDCEIVLAMLLRLTSIYSAKLTFLVSFKPSPCSKFACESI